jgi:hypothetical protein
VEAARGPSPSHAEAEEAADAAASFAQSQCKLQVQGQENIVMQSGILQSDPQLLIRSNSFLDLFLHHFGRYIFPSAFAAFLLISAASVGQQGNEKTFASPGDAVLALYKAAKSDNTPLLSVILGTNSGDIIHTGDEVADKNMAANFIRRYDQMHRVVIEPDQTATLYIGAENWPFPISIVKNNSGAWYFDTESGKIEILQRRVGRNENDAIDVLHALVDAQHDYASELRGGDKVKHYAAKFISDAGKENGLYWKTADTESDSPIGPLLADAASEGYQVHQGQATPFHGYYYRILTKQGSAAKGGARDYIVDGKLARGFAFVAYPAQYRNSGVMTFIVNQNGIVYEKDLGEQTPEQANAMQEYEPDNTWVKAD